MWHRERSCHHRVTRSVHWAVCFSDGTCSLAHIYNRALRYGGEIDRCVDISEVRQGTARKSDGQREKGWEVGVYQRDEHVHKQRKWEGERERGGISGNETRKREFQLVRTTHVEGAKAIFSGRQISMWPPTLSRPRLPAPWLPYFMVREPCRSILCRMRCAHLS